MLTTTLQRRLLAVIGLLYAVTDSVPIEASPPTQSTFVDNPAYIRDFQPSLGTGYRTDRGEFTGIDCGELLATGWDTVGGTSVDVSLSMTSSLETVRDQLGLRAKWSVGGLLASARGAVDLTLSEVEKRTKISLYYLARVNLPNIRLTLKARPPDILQPEWHVQCGDSLVTELALGLRVLVGVEFSAIDEETLREFRADMAISVPFASLKAKVDELTNKYSGRVAVVVRAEQFGGNPNHLLDRVGGVHAARCALNAFSECHQYISQLMSYLSELGRTIESWNHSLRSATGQSRFSWSLFGSGPPLVTGFGVRSHESIGIPVPPAVRVPGDVVDARDNLLNIAALTEERIRDFDLFATAIRSRPREFLSESCLKTIDEQEIELRKERRAIEQIADACFNHTEYAKCSDYVGSLRNSILPHRDLSAVHAACAVECSPNEAKRITLPTRLGEDFVNSNNLGGSGGMDWCALATKAVVVFSGEVRLQDDITLAVAKVVFMPGARIVLNEKSLNIITSEVESSGPVTIESGFPLGAVAKPGTDHHRTRAKPGKNQEGLSPGGGGRGRQGGNGGDGTPGDDGSNGTSSGSLHLFARKAKGAFGQWTANLSGMDGGRGGHGGAGGHGGRGQKRRPRDGLFGAGPGIPGQGGPGGDGGKGGNGGSGGNGGHFFLVVGETPPVFVPPPKSAIITSGGHGGAPGNGGEPGKGGDPGVISPLGECSPECAKTAGNSMICGGCYRNRKRPDGSCVQGPSRCLRLAGPPGTRGEAGRPGRSGAPGAVRIEIGVDPVGILRLARSTLGEAPGQSKLR